MAVQQLNMNCENCQKPRISLIDNTTIVNRYRRDCRPRMNRVKFIFYFSKFASVILILPPPSRPVPSSY